MLREVTMRTTLRASLSPATDRRRWAAALAVCLFAAVIVGGCSASSQWVKVRDTPRNPLASSLNLVSRKGPKPTQRTMQLLRRYNLADQWSGDRQELLTQLEELQQREPDRENEYAMAELAYITAKEAEHLPEMFQRGRALEFYGTSLVHAYRYFFDYKDALPLNAYDPQFRGASDLYNQSLEGMLRLVKQEDELRPGTTRTIRTSSHICTCDIVMRSSGWHAEDFDHVEFVSDYQLQGLRNHYHNYGLGVPLIAIVLFLGAWAWLAPKVQTSLGLLPGPVQVWQQTQNLWADHLAERQKEVAFYQRQDKRNAEALAKDPGFEAKYRPYTGKPTFIDQIVTSLQTVFTGSLCIECDACMDICPVDCINFIGGAPEDELRGKLRVPALDKTQDIYASGALKTGRIMAKDEDMCLHCGLCAERCPTGAWDMQKYFYVEAQASHTTLQHHSAYLR